MLRKSTGLTRYSISLDLFLVLWVPIVVEVTWPESECVQCTWKGRGCSQGADCVDSGSQGGQGVNLHDYAVPCRDEWAQSNIQTAPVFSCIGLFFCKLKHAIKTLSCTMPLKVKVKFSLLFDEVESRCFSSLLLCTFRCWSRPGLSLGCTWRSSLKKTSSQLCGSPAPRSKPSPLPRSTLDT